MSETSTNGERDRVATELRYVTRPYDWNENPEWRTLLADAPTSGEPAAGSPRL